MFCQIYASARQEVLDLVNLSGTFIPFNIDSDREGLLDY